MLLLCIHFVSLPGLVNIMPWPNGQDIAMAGNRLNFQFEPFPPTPLLSLTKSKTMSVRLWCALSNVELRKVVRHTYTLNAIPVFPQGKRRHSTEVACSSQWVAASTCTEAQHSQLGIAPAEATKQLLS